jgi:very-short-patch-repair endonuclease
LYDAYSLPKTQYNFELSGKFYDFYIPEKHLLIEVDGIYWHGRNIKNLNETQKRIRINDWTKNILARVSGYKLIRFWEDEIGECNVSKRIL